MEHNHKGVAGRPVPWESRDYSCQCVKHAAQDFTQQASLHGLRYIGDKSISRVERWFWLVACLAAALFAVHFILNVCQQWVSSPVALTLSPQTTDLNDIPFPAVTICNTNQVRKSVALDILKRANSSDERGLLERKLLNDYCHLPQDPGDADVNEDEIQWAAVQEFMFKNTSITSQLFRGGERTPLLRERTKARRGTIPQSRKTVPFDYTLRRGQRSPLSMFRSPVPKSSAPRKTQLKGMNKTNSGLSSQVSQNCSEMAVACFWHGEKFDCGKLFIPSLTGEGFCCVFNAVKKEYLFNYAGWTGLNQTLPYESLDWTLESGYPEGTPPYTLPWRPWGPGSQMGLRVVLDAELDEYFCSTEVSMGFKVAVHNPTETPKMTAYASIVQPGKETRVVAEPVVWTSSREQLEDVPVAKRNCLFHDERSLAFHRTYSQRNCMLECETNFTLQACGCVFFYMSKHESIKICGRNESKCALKALTAIETNLVDDGDTFTTLSSENSTKACDCKTGCFAISYRNRVSTSRLIDKASSIPSELMGGKDPAYFSKNMAIINIYFTDAHFTSIHRALSYTFTDFLADTGGLLGLFMGFSFLSAVEGLYFLTLRLWCFLVRNRHVLHTESPRAT